MTNYYSNSNRRMGRVCNSLLLTIVLLCGSIPACASPQGSGYRSLEIATARSEISIIPQPNSITINNGYFEFSRRTKIIAADGAAVKLSTSLNSILREKHGFTLEITADTSAPNSIAFLMADGDQTKLGAEGYSLKIEPGSIQISGTERGMFYGIQSLTQLFPPQFNGEAQIPAAVIRDAPRFRYRGMHLDVARHFMPIDFVKRYIQLISTYKYNFFHWHLTDDQGWRIEIKKYPLLTQIGSRREETVFEDNYPGPSVSDRYRGYIGDGRPVEGFYTQEQIRDVVAYAKARYVTIIPEIDLPGHSASALASYPDLGCKKNYKYKVHTTFGAFPDIYCPTEPTFEFIEGVLTEVIDLFSDSPYLHIGGDEVRFTEQWTNSRYVQNLMRKNGFSTTTELQRWFMDRVAKFVSSKQKKTIVWDEMVKVGLPAKATVMSWLGVQNAVAAARAQHEVIMSPWLETYFDHPQDEIGKDQKIYTYSKTIGLSKVYNFDPTAGLSPEVASYIIGGEGCIWTENTRTPAAVERMMFPRTIALAEALWTQKENKSPRGFTSRLTNELRNLDRQQVNYWGKLSGTRPRTTAEVFQPGFEKPATETRVGRPLVSVHQVMQARSLGGKELPYRISLPADYENSSRRYPVLYLLHGVTGNENDWWERSKLAEYALKYQMIIVTPGVGDSWYANSASDAGARYEDVIVYDLIPYIDGHYRTITSREGRAIAGVSMGGLGAMKLALRYPQLFEFAGSLSGPFDVPITARWGKTPTPKMLRDLQLIFGDEGSQTRRDNDVFQLLNQSLSSNAILPYLYVSSGMSDPQPQVSQSNQRFAQALGAKDLKFEYNQRPGMHNWSLWDSEIYLMLGRMCVFMKRICS